MSNYNAKDSQVLGRQLKVQRLSIPLVITANATPASVGLSNDEPAILFLKTEGVNQIAAVADGTPTFTAANDANGIFNILVDLQEPCAKVLNAQVISRNAAAAVVCTLANTTGLTAEGDKIVLNCDTAVDLSTTSLNACLVVEYVCAE